MFKKKIILILSFSLFSFSFSQEKKEKIIFDNFESGDYNKWVVEGEAFGNKPTVIQKVTENRISYKTEDLLSNNRGKYTVLSLTKSGSHVLEGKLTSKPFTIKKKFINFLIWGGSGKKVGFRLLIDGKEVALARGEDSKEAYEDSFDVSKHIGKQAVLEIFDGTKGAWGHIGVDNITFSDESLSCDNSE